MSIPTSSPLNPVPVASDNTSTPPLCEKDCVYRLRYDNFSLDANLLENHMEDQWRCGWNLKEGVLGGRPLDYAPCIFPPKLD